MKILVVSQYFYPENFRINDLIFSLKERGHEITVLTGKPNYSKTHFLRVMDGKVMILKSLMKFLCTGPIFFQEEMVER